MNLVKHVDPFIGVDGGGNCLCGPYLPLSLVRVGPDVSGQHPTSGYSSGKPIIGFSNNHVSGTGGGGRYGNIRVVPWVSKPETGDIEYNVNDEYAEVGYYNVWLDPVDIRAELTSTQRTAFHRYSFPDSDNVGLTIDLGAIIQSDDNHGSAVSIGGYFEAVGCNEIFGRADLRGGWGHDYPYSVYFYLKSEESFLSVKSIKDGKFCEEISAYGKDLRVVLEYGDLVQRKSLLSKGQVLRGAFEDEAVCGQVSGETENQVNIRIGISYVSVANARASVERESIGKSFEEIRRDASNEWEEVLNKIKVFGGTDEDIKMFYTMFYRLYCMPSDLGVDDEMPIWESGVRHFTDYYCLWDSVRNANSLITLIDPELEADLLNCLLDVGDHIGWVPDAWIAFHGAHVQGGASADVLISEAAKKGIEGIDYEKAIDQMRKNNEVESPDPHLYGRYLPEYRDLGYVTTNTLNCASRHIEYSYQDWCIANLAEILGQNDVKDRYIESSKKIWNLWRDDLKVFSPKKPDGEWADFDPYKPTRKDFWNDPYYYEGVGVEWTLSAFHVMDVMIKKHGGTKAFDEFLDDYFEKRYSWKEFNLHTPYLYHYVGKPEKSVDKVRELIREKYSPTRSGLPDNEDMGAQSSFWICSAIGLYPIMGQDLYFLATPFFEEIEIQLGTSGKVLKIFAPGAEGPNGKTKYIKSAKINGETIDSCFIKHSQIVDGGILEIELEN